MPAIPGGGGRPPNAAEREEAAWDEYAAAAMSTLIAKGKYFNNERGHAQVAENAASHADAMLEERRKRYALNKST